MVAIAALMSPTMALAQPRTTGDAKAEPPPEPTDATPDTGGTPADKPVDGAANGPAKAAAATESLVVVVQPRFVWEPFGYLRLQYIAVQNDPNIAFVGRGDGFELQNARVGVRGVLDRRAAFVVSFDGAVDERAQINVPEGKLKVGLRDAYADVALGAQLEQPAGVTHVPFNLAARAGFFQTWFEPESLLPDNQREFVDRPIESRGIRATEGFQAQGLTPGHSLGAAIRLDPAVSAVGIGGGFELAVQNGADEFSSNNDNDKPAVSLAGLLRIRPDGYLVAAGRYNPRTVGDLPFRQDETDLEGSVGLRIAVGPATIGGGAVVVHTSFPTTGGPGQNAYGAHGQLMIGVGSRALPLAFGYRFGLLDPSSLILTDRVMEHTAGAVLGVPRYRMRLQLQLTHAIEQAGRTLSNDRAQLAAEVTL
jgi:hypothetical protein